MPRPRSLGFTERRSRPSSATEPEVASTNPAIICSVVVLPHPDGPSSETNSHFSTESDSESTARWSPKRFVSLSRTRKGMSSALDLAVPPLGPLVALRVHGVPVDVHELRGALADGSDLAL